MAEPNRLPNLGQVVFLIWVEMFDVSSLAGTLPRVHTEIFENDIFFWQAMVVVFVFRSSPLGLSREIRPRDRAPPSTKKRTKLNSLCVYPLTFSESENILLLWA